MQNILGSNIPIVVILNPHIRGYDVCSPQFVPKTVVELAAAHGITVTEVVHLNDYRIADMEKK